MSFWRHCNKTKSTHYKFCIKSLSIFTKIRNDLIQMKTNERKHFKRPHNWKTGRLFQIFTECKFKYRKSVKTAGIRDCFSLNYTTNEIDFNTMLNGILHAIYIVHFNSFYRRTYRCPSIMEKSTLNKWRQLLTVHDLPPETSLGGVRLEQVFWSKIRSPECEKNIANRSKTNTLFPSLVIRRKRNRFTLL